LCDGCYPGDPPPVRPRNGTGGAGGGRYHTIMHFFLTQLFILWPCQACCLLRRNMQGLVHPAVGRWAKRPARVGRREWPVRFSCLCQHLTLLSVHIGQLLFSAPCMHNQNVFLLRCHRGSMARLAWTHAPSCQNCEVSLEARAGAGATRQSDLAPCQSLCYSFW